MKIELAIFKPDSETITERDFKLTLNSYEARMLSAILKNGMINLDAYTVIGTRNKEISQYSVKTGLSVISGLIDRLLNEGWV